MLGLHKKWNEKGCEVRWDDCVRHRIHLSRLVKFVLWSWFKPSTDPVIDDERSVVEVLIRMVNDLAVSRSNWFDQSNVVYIPLVWSFLLHNRYEYNCKHPRILWDLQAANKFEHMEALLSWGLVFAYCRLLWMEAALSHNIRDLL